MTGVCCEIALTDGRRVVTLVMRRLGAPGYVLPLLQRAAGLLAATGRGQGDPELAARAVVACDGAEAVRLAEGGGELVLDCFPACGLALRTIDYVYVVDVRRPRWRVRVFKPGPDIALLSRWERDRLYARAVGAARRLGPLRLEEVAEVSAAR